VTTAVALAFAAGLVATVNPCGFAMLPAFLAFYVGADDPVEAGAGRAAGRLAQGLAVGLAVSGGFAGVFAAAALLASAGLAPLVRLAPWVALAIGLALVGLGVALLAGRHVGLTVARASRPRPQRGPLAGRSLRRVVWFGAAYALASLSCTLAVLLALAGQALAAADPLRLAGVLAAYAAGASSVLVALSVSAALAKGALVRAMRRLLPLASRLGGGLLVASGLYLLAYWAPLLAPSGRPVASPAAGIGAALSGRLTAVVLAGRGAFAAVAAVTVVVLAGTLAVIVRRRAARAATASAPSREVR
jgi:cytochrome c biogenesis protein CcdA